MIHSDEHVTLYQGDFRKVLANMPPVNLILTSPPYNIGSKAPKCTGRRALGGFDRKSYQAITSYEDNLPEDVYQSQQTEAMRWMAAHIAPNGTVAYNHKVRHSKCAVINPVKWFPEELTQVEDITWDRGSTHNHSKFFLYPETERIYVFTRKGFEHARFFHNERPGCSDIWRFSRDYTRGLKHDARYPLELARRCIRLWSRPGDTVCDPYSGSGTTMIAAFLEERKFIGAELMPEHFNEAVKRYLSTRATV